MLIYFINEDNIYIFQTTNIFITSEIIGGNILKLSEFENLLLVVVDEPLIITKLSNY